MPLVTMMPPPFPLLLQCCPLQSFSPVPAPPRRATRRPGRAARTAAALAAAALAGLAAPGATAQAADPMPDVRSAVQPAEPVDPSWSGSAGPRSDTPAPSTAPSALQRWFRRGLPAPAPNPFGLPVTAGPLRVFPQTSRLGSMTPGVFPLVSIDGTALRFAAGAVIRNQANMIVSPGTLASSAWPVRYVLDSAGQVAQAWILTDAELASEARRPRASAGAGTTAASPAW